MTESAANTEIEPELLGATPRPLRLDAGTRAIRWLVPALLALVLGLVWMAVALSQSETERFVREGRVTEARVLDKRRSEGKASEDYRLDYVYTVNGKRIEGRDYVSEELYRRTAVDGPLTITYLASNPQIQRSGTVDAEQAARDARTGKWIIGAMALCFLGVALLLERYFRRALNLLRNGAPARARIVDWSKPVSPRFPTYRIRCEYSVPGGETIRKTFAVKADIAQVLIQHDEATVLYNPQKPRESLYYRCFSISPSQARADRALD